VVAKAPLVALALAAATAAHADDTRYTLADLESLVANKAFQEALVHASDIPPTQRTQKWIDVTATAAGGVIASLTTDDGATLIAITEIDRRYPQLLKSASYVKLRGELGIKGLAGCFDVSRDCGELALKLVEGDARLAFDVAKVCVANDNVVAVALFARGFDTKLCKDEKLQRAMMAGLEFDRESKTAGEARTLMTKCWNAVETKIVDEFGSAGKGSRFHKNTCDVLAAKKLLSALQLKRCK